MFPGALQPLLRVCVCGGGVPWVPLLMHAAMGAITHAARVPLRTLPWVLKCITHGGHCSCCHVHTAAAAPVPLTLHCCSCCPRVPGKTYLEKLTWKNCTRHPKPTGYSLSLSRVLPSPHPIKGAPKPSTTQLCRKSVWS